MKCRLVEIDFSWEHHQAILHNCNDFRLKFMSKIICFPTLDIFLKDLSIFSFQLSNKLFSLSLCDLNLYAIKDIVRRIKTLMESVDL